MAGRARGRGILSQCAARFSSSPTCAAMNASSTINPTTHMRMRSESVFLGKFERPVMHGWRPNQAESRSGFGLIGLSDAASITARTPQSQRVAFFGNPGR